MRLVQEDDHIAVWEEIFEPGVPAAAHRHTRDYVAVFPDGGEITVTHLAGELETYTFISGDAETLSASEGSARFAFPANTIVHSRVPNMGTGHTALNEGDRPVRMILIEIKGTAMESETSGD